MERYENDLRQYAILIAADKDLQKELTEKEISQSQSVKRSKIFTQYLENMNCSEANAYVLK